MEGHLSRVRRSVNFAWILNTGDNSLSKDFDTRTVGRHKGNEDFCFSAVFGVQCMYKDVCGTQWKASPKCVHISPDRLLAIGASKCLPCYHSGAHAPPKNLKGDRMAATALFARHTLSGRRTNGRSGCPGRALTQARNIMQGKLERTLQAHKASIHA